MTKRWIWMAVAASMMLAGGCKKDGKKEDPATGSGSVAAGAAGTADTAAALAALPTGVDRLLAALPKASGIVIGIDIGRLQSSALLGPMLEQVMTANAARMGFDAKAVCGIDPSKMVGMALIGITSTSATDGQIAVAFSGIDKAAMLPCFEKGRAHIEGQKLQLTIDGDNVFVSGAPGGKSVNIGIAFSDDGVAVMKFGKDPIDKADLAKMAAARVGHGLTGSKDFMAMVKATNTGATIWGLANGGAPLMQRLPVKFTSASGSIDITDGIMAEGRMRMESADKATQVTQMFGGHLATVKQMGLADVAEMKPDGNDVKITFSMKKQQVETLKAIVTSQIGNMMRGLGGGMPGGMGSGLPPPSSAPPSKPPPPPAPPSKPPAPPSGP